MNTTTDLPRIPLSALHLSPLNARKVRPTDIESLAASIAAHGLLQNLTVTVNAKPGQYEVVAGGRRLAAMQQLAKQKRLPAALQAGVPCLVIEDNDVAHEASTAENTLREAMHPADQFDAFKRMVDAGKPIADVAAHFGVAELVVKQRLKLANVADDLFQLYRNDGMDLDDLQALAITDDHDAQRRVWNDLPEWQRSAHSIRRALTESQVSARSALAQFVGLDEYVAAGGTVTRDLFSTREDVYFNDRALLDKLAADKLERKAQALRDAGWSWVEVHPRLDYAKAAEYPKMDQSLPEDWLPSEKAARLEVVETRINEIENTASEDLDDEQRSAFEDELAKLDDEREAIMEASEERWPAECMQQGGAIVAIDTDGDPQILLGRLKPGQKLAKSGQVTGTPKQAKAEKGKPAKPELSADLRNRLCDHRSAAVRAALAADPKFAPDLLIAHLLQQLVTSSYGEGLDIQAKNAHKRAGAANDRFPGMPQPSTRATLDAAVKALDMPRKATDILPWVQKLDDAKFSQVLAAIAALTLTNLYDRDLVQLADTLKVDMTQHWQPDAAHYLAHTNKALILEAVIEARGKDAAAKLANLKREPLIAEAAKLLAGTGWLPKPLRGVGYKATTANTATTKPTKPAKKAGAKKPAAKKAKKQPAKKAKGGAA